MQNGKNSRHEDDRSKLTCRNEIWEPAGARGAQPTVSMLPSAKEAPSVCSKSRGRECACPALSLGLARGSLAGTLCMGGWGAETGQADPRPRVRAPRPTPQWATLQGVWATAVSQCLEVVGQHACILAPRGDPQVCPHSLPRSVAGQLSSVPGWLPAVPWVSPASLLVPSVVTFQMNCSPCLRSAAGEPRRTETAVGLGAPCLPVG